MDERSAMVGFNSIDEYFLRGVVFHTMIGGYRSAKFAATTTQCMHDVFNGGGTLTPLL